MSDGLKTKKSTIILKEKENLQQMILQYLKQRGFIGSQALKLYRLSF